MKYGPPDVRPIIFGVARAICEGRGANPDARVFAEGPAPIWTDQIRVARAALDRTAIMLRAVGQVAAAEYIEKELGYERSTYAQTRNDASVAS